LSPSAEGAILRYIIGPRICIMFDFFGLQLASAPHTERSTDFGSAEKFGSF